MNFTPHTSSFWKIISHVLKHWTQLFITSLLRLETNFNSCFPFNSSLNIKKALIKTAWMKNFPSSKLRLAWFLDKTLQSKYPLSESAFSSLWDLPIRRGLEDKRTTLSSHSKELSFLDKRALAVAIFGHLISLQLLQIEYSV